MNFSEYIILQEILACDAIIEEHMMRSSRPFHSKRDGKTWRDIFEVVVAKITRDFKAQSFLGTKK